MSSPYSVNDFNPDGNTSWAKLFHLVPEGSRVLDIGCSAGGFGLALQEFRGCTVTGIDLNEDDLAIAKTRLSAVHRVDITTDPDLERLGTFDVLIFADVLEHLVDPREALRRVRPLLAERGRVLYSIPNMGHITVRLDLVGGNFPYTEIGLLDRTHIHYYDRREVLSLFTDAGYVLEHEEYVGLAYPRSWIESRLSSLGLAPDEHFWSMLDDTDAFVFQNIGVAEPKGEPSRTQVAHTKAEVANDEETSALDAAYRENQRLHAELARLGEAVRTRAGRDKILRDKPILRDRLASRDAELQGDALVWETLELRRGYVAAVQELEEERDRIAAYRSTRPIRAVETLRRGVIRAIPTGTARRRVVEAGLRATARTVRALQGIGRSPRRGAGSIEVPHSETPLVSIVIPIHGEWEYTERCLRSIVAHHDPSHEVEVVIVDDRSPDDSLARVRKVRGARIVALEENVGFTRAANAGIAAARGTHVLMLNNDTEVSQGWLGALLDAAADETVGLVGAKLVYPDGRLQEAGGIIFDDASGWNYGRLDNPSRPEYNFRKRVDYCSGAALLLTRRLLDLVPAFDERYAPAYYEDADMAFEARAHGLECVYEPHAVVIHHEGVSNGTDATGSTGLKRFQPINQEKFRGKWAADLRRQFPKEGFEPGLLPIPSVRRGARGTVVFVDDTVPMHREAAGGLRTRRLVEQLRSLGHDVIFVPESGYRVEPYTAELEELGILVWTGVGLESYLRTIEAQIAYCVVARVSTAINLLAVIREAIPDVPVFFDTVDLHFLRAQREATLSGGSDGIARLLRELETGVMRSTEGTLVVSEAEEQILLELVPEVRVFRLGLVNDPVPVRDDVERTAITFVGGFGHMPNQDGIRWFLTDVLPLVEERIPGVPVTVVGRGAPDDVVATAPGNVAFVGWVEDLEPYHAKSRVSIAPLRYGAGVKGKIADAWAHGVPVVMTSIGAEGMGVNDGETGIVADTPEAFAEGIVRLYEDRELWRRVSAAGQEQGDRLFGSGAIRDRLAEIAAFASSLRKGPA